MLLRRIAALLIVLLPVVSASDCSTGDALVAGRAVDPQALQVGLVVEGEGVEPGDVVPLCDDEPPLEADSRVFGSVEGGCFQSSSAVVVLGPGFTCEPVDSGIYLFPEPRIDEPQVDEDCIQGIIDDLIGQP